MITSETDHTTTRILLVAALIVSLLGIAVIAAGADNPADPLTRKVQIMEKIFDEVLGAGIGERIVALSGPSFAREVAAEHPTAVVAASRTHENAQAVQALFSTPTFRVYAGDDIVGVELGGPIDRLQIEQQLSRVDQRMSR